MVPEIRVALLLQWLGRIKSQWANGPMLTQINGPFQISMGHGIKCMGHGIKCMGHQWVSIRFRIIINSLA